jgi:hypothetical protein
MNSLNLSKGDFTPGQSTAHLFTVLQKGSRMFKNIFSVALSLMLSLSEGLGTAQEKKLEPLIVSRLGGDKRGLTRDDHHQPGTLFRRH